MSTTTNLSLNEPAYNSTSPTWDQPLNYNSTILDAVFGNTTSVALTNSNVTLTGPTSTGTGQTQAMRIVLTGALSANVTVTIPTGISGRWIIYNTTTNAYTVTIASGGGGNTVNVLQGVNTQVYSDGTNIQLCDNGILAGSPSFTNITVSGNINTSSIVSGGTLNVTGNISPTGRITPRVSVTNAPSSPFSWNSNNYDEMVLTGISNALTINSDTGSPVQGQTIIFCLKDNGTSQTLSWNSQFRQIGAFLPTATTANKTSYVGAIYNSIDSFWDVVAVTTQT